MRTSARARAHGKSVFPRKTFAWPGRAQANILECMLCVCAYVLRLTYMDVCYCIRTQVHGLQERLARKRGLGKFILYLFVCWCIYRV